MEHIPGWYRLVALLKRETRIVLAVAVFSFLIAYGLWAIILPEMSLFILWIGVGIVTGLITAVTRPFRSMSRTVQKTSEHVPDTPDEEVQDMKG